MMTWDDRMIKKEFRKALFPIMFSVLGGTINTLIDSAMVSQSEGPDALAAVTLCMPIYLVQCVIGVLFASGASIIAVNQIGKNRTHEARKVYFSALTWYVICGVIMTVGGAFLAGPLSQFIAQGTDLTGYVYDYGVVMILGTFPTILVYVPIYFLQIEGKPRSISRLIIIMLITDVVFDYVLLFPCHMGILGAAIATVISTAIACVYGFASLQRGHLFRFSIKEMKLYMSRKIIRFGSPSALGNLVDAIKMVILNGIILYNLGASGTAVWAVLNCLSEISMTVTSGVPQTAAPMIGVYYPSRENSAIRTLMKKQFIWGMNLLLVFGALLVIGNQVVQSIFAVKEDMLIPLLCLCLFMLFDIVSGMWVRYLNTIGRIALSNVINIMRKMGFPVILTHIHIFRGENLWLFLPVSGLLTVLLTFILIWITSKREEKKGRKLSRLLLLDDELEKTKRVLDFSIPTKSDEVCDAAERISEFCQLHGMKPKVLMRLSLSIEEMLMVLIGKIPSASSVDLRAFVTDDETGIQIRYVGEFYNPFEDEEKGENEDMMGVVMMEKLATMTDHYYALGINTIHLFFAKE